MSASSHGGGSCCPALTTKSLNTASVLYNKITGYLACCLEVCLTTPSPPPLFPVCALSSSPQITPSLHVLPLQVLTRKVGEDELKDADFAAYLATSSSDSDSSSEGEQQEQQQPQQHSRKKQQPQPQRQQNGAHKDSSRKQKRRSSNAEAADDADALKAK